MKLNLPPDHHFSRDRFIFGVATSSFQIEGAAVSRLPTIWDSFCQQPGRVIDGSNGDTACDHVALWQQDLDLIESLSVDAYRFSISWARVIDEQSQLDPQGVAFYVALLDRLKRKNIKAFVTLYHWDLPLHLQQKGGWLNRETAYRFAEYTNLISQALGDRVYSFCTLNEPWCSAYLGYETGEHAPGMRDPALTKKVIHHLLLAHGLAMKVLRRNCPKASCGIVLNFSPSHPASASDADLQAAQLADIHFNQWYIKPLMEGRYPALIHELPESWQPDILAGDLAIISEPMDYLGINYYSRAVYRADPNGGFVAVAMNEYPLTDMGWEIYPQGLTEILVAMDQKYDLPPVYITENGAAMADKLMDGQVADSLRVQYLQLHLNALHQAMVAGVDVRGYFAWSLLDNFEWAWGYEKRFGLVYVDYPTQQRTIKSSGLAFRQMLQDRRNSNSNKNNLGDDQVVNQ